jgi:hypothetical protein
MAKKTEKKILEKKKWVANFNLVGKAKINDYTYKIDEKSEKSDWIYNTLNLGVDCGEKFGTVYAEMMGGYGAKRDNVCYVHGKDDDNKDDFENKFTVDWDDRTDSDILETVGDMCFIKIGLEKDKQDKTVTTRFLSPYDAITYIKENLADGTVINVKGNLKYQLYDGKVSVKKEITSIYLSKAEPEKYHASFTQSLLIKSDSLGDYNKDKGIIPLYGTVLEYTKMYNDKEVKCFIPMTKMFEIEVEEDKIKFWKDKLCKVKKNTVSEIVFEGDLIEGGALIETKVDDLPDDIKELIEIGAYTEEEALARCTENAGREKRMIIRKPSVKMVGDEGKKIPVIQKIEEKYSEEDLILDFMFEDNSDDDDNTDTDTDTDTDNSDTDSDDDWLSALN